MQALDQKLYYFKDPAKDAEASNLFGSLGILNCDWQAAVSAFGRCVVHPTLTVSCRLADSAGPDGTLVGLRLRLVRRLERQCRRSNSRTLACARFRPCVLRLQEECSAGVSATAHSSSSAPSSWWVQCPQQAAHRALPQGLLCPTMALQQMGYRRECKALYFLVIIGCFFRGARLTQGQCARRLSCLAQPPESSLAGLSGLIDLASNE